MNIILDHDANYYRNYGGESRVNFDVYEKLKADSSIYWPNFDRWFKGVNDSFYYQSDGYLDFLLMVHRRTWSNGPLYHVEGYTPLGSANGWENYTIYAENGDTIRINGSYNSNGSGCKVLGKFGVVTKQLVIGAGTHEHGHYLFGSGHISYGKMCSGFGLDFSLSPWELIKLGYSGKETVSYSQSGNYYLNEYSARDTTNKVILQVPISSTQNDEFFLIANRRKLSPWDRIMLGDTAHDNPLKKINEEYGKGIYIYHIIDGFGYPSFQDVCKMDQECADGLYNWESEGLFAPDWDPYNVFLPVHKQISVSYLNDISNLNNGLSNRDGKSIKDYTMSNEMKWGAIGKKETILYGDGTDKIFVNDTDIWTSRDWKGDRWDAWNVGYNEVFSPYSSPNTFSWNNDTTGIFIWYYSLNGNTANLKIYRASAYGGNQSLDSILKWTPPSKPMGLNIDVTDCIDNRRYPVLTWNHNSEPDMLQTGMRPQKRYKIYRAWEEIQNVPVNYEEIADVLIDASTNYAEFIDYDTYAQCDNGTPEENYRLRYKVRAVDIYEDTSVYSDFAAISTYYLNRGGEVGDGIHSSISFQLSQNYPNPFNPATNIQFTIQNSGHVNLKVYDVLGREVKNIVNEFKQAGSYIVSFDGSELSSGIYFYRLESGDFVQVKRMILLK